MANDEVNGRFEKFAAELRKIAPKAKDFLYFSSIVMSAGECALLDENGKPKIGKDGKEITAEWKENGDSVKWICSDPSIKPFKNSNGDIFSASELIKHHKKFIGKPTCIDHNSSSVDGVRGIILDAYYDYTTRKVIALMAIDKLSYPELARKISSGVSTSVSMGTVVKRAICYDCGQVARSERDFCQHMKNKTSYGEINFDLEPIEISIVNSPADPTAKIRTIFASAQYIKNSIYSSDIREKIAQIQQNLNEVSNDLSELTDISKEETENNAPVYADFNALLSELKILKSSMEQTLEDLNKKQEDIMTSDRDNSMDKKAYFQGGGGVNEPTRGKVKYPAEPLNEQLRDNEDKQMLQTKDFGGEGDDKIKAEVRPIGAGEKAARRKEALENAKKNLDKKGYWQGGGGVNEPEPGKVKYEIDPLAAQVRNEDKQMVGQKPFPDVGDVDGLHPSPESAEDKDELERKKKLSRAGLTARFIRKAGLNGKDDLANSGWQVFAKDENGQKLIFTASVNEISAGQTDQLFDMIATKEFGGKMLEKIREVGLEKAASVYKKAQDAAPPPPAAPPAPAADMGAPPPADDKDAGGKGDPKEVALDLAEKTRDSASELLEAVRDLTGSQAEMGDLEDGIKALPQATASLLTPAAEMRQKLEKMLVSAAKKSLSELKAHYSELKLIADMADAETVKNASINTMIETAFEEAQAVISTSEGILRSYAKYASGVENLVNRVKTAQDEEEKEEDKKEDENKADDGFGDFENDLGLDDHQDGLMNDELDLGPDTEKEPDLGPDTVKEPHDLEAFDREQRGKDNFGMDEINNTNDGLLVELAPGQPVPPGAKAVAEDPMAPKAASMDLTTKAGRDAYRKKLAEHVTDSVPAESIKFNPVMDEANKLADGQTELDVKPSDNLGLVETKPEVNKRMLEVARAAPKVKKEAARLNDMIVSGLVKKADLDKLVAEGLDSEVVKYWREFYGQVDGGPEFAKLLTAETEKAKVAAEMETYKIKLARSYEVANEMARVGLITNERAAIARQVDDTMKWNDDAFDSVKRVIAKSAAGTMKTAGLVPQVGIRETNDTYSPSNSDDLQSELDRAFSGRKY